MRIGGNHVGLDSPPFIIAEMSGNHGGVLERALQIVDAAAAAGAHALKLQTYTADTMTLDIREGDFLISEQDNLWSGRSLYDLYEQAHTPWEWHEPIFERAREHGLAGFSSPFDASAVDFLEDLDVPAYKIASLENTDLPLIEAVASTGRPVIISTGLATLSEIDQAVSTARAAGCRDLVLLKCTSSYPSDPSESNLRSIPELRRLFGCEVGLSDHTLGIGAAVASVALGGSVIEKHVVLDRAAGDVDGAFSLEPPELQQLVTETETAWRSLGKVAFGPQPSEATSLRLRRSLYVTRDLPAGHRVGRDDVRAIRPGAGLSPAHLDDVLGQALATDVLRGTPVGWDLFRPPGPVEGISGPTDDRPR